MIRDPEKKQQKIFKFLHDSTADETKNKRKKTTYFDNFSFIISPHTKNVP